MVPHPLNLKKENQKNQALVLPPLSLWACVVQKAPQVILKPVPNALKHGDRCKYEAIWIGNRMLLQQKPNLCGIDWAVRSYDTDIRDWNNES